jgi:methyl-accepting chemotaxis protein
MSTRSISVGRGLGAALGSLKVKTKVLLGFAVILALLAVVSAISFFGFSSISSQFGHYTAAVTVVADASGIERDLTELRRDIDNYVGTRNAAAAEAAVAMEKKIQAEIEAGLKAATTEEQKAGFEDMSKRLAALVADFVKVEELESDRVKLASDVLDVAGPKATEDLEKLVRQATQAGDSNTAILANAALTEILKARLYANLMLARHETGSDERAEAAFEGVAAAMGQIEKVASDPALRASLEEIKAAVASYAEAFKHSEAIDSELESLVGEVIAEEAETIMHDAEAIVEDATADEERIAEETHGVIGSSEILAIAISLGGIALGLVVAWLIGGGIARPVISMTAAMAKLAGGDKTTAIPALDRKDEIGSMAQAVQVFKDAMIKAEELAAAQERERAAKEARAKRIEDETRAFDKAVGGILETVSAASTELDSTASSMSATAEETSRQATAVAAASEQASTNVQTVASAAEELASSIAEISRQVSQSTEIAGKAMAEATRTNTTVKSLAEAAQKIGAVVNLINEIASQTNLLALNATIEAARAGEAGKGFAVVASEVKSLANQTAKATEEIGSQIGAMQSVTGEAVTAIEGIGTVITQINEIATTIASAVEEQGAATQEIARNVQQASAGTRDVSANISGVTQASGETGAAANQVLAASGELSKQADALKRQVESFLGQVRAA